MSTNNITTDLNATIASAVNARIEAEVAKALSGDEVIGQYVAAALNQEIEVERSYRKTKTTWLKHTLRKAMQDSTKAVIQRVLEEELPLIEEEVRKAVKREAGAIAEGIAKSLAERGGRGYGIDVKFRMPGESD